MGNNTEFDKYGKLEDSGFANKPKRKLDKVTDVTTSAQIPSIIEKFCKWIDKKIKQTGEIK